MGKSLGIGVIGSGRIGTLRARLASQHPSVDFWRYQIKTHHRQKN